MQQITWLHLSDWHQKGSDFGRTVGRDALIKDIRERQEIAPELSTVDFVVFSGDLTFSGARAEYEAAQKQLLDPVLQAAGVGRDRLVIVPGNHDLDREFLIDIAPELQTSLDSDELVEKWLTGRRLTKTLEPFEAYRDFVSEYTGRTQPDYASVLRFDVRGTKVGVLGLNSAWMTARNKDAKGEVDDYGFTLIGEPQVHDAIAQIAEDQLRIAVMHHPFDWLSRFDRNRIEGRLYRACHFILCGHVHDAQVQVMRGTMGNAIFIPAGASWDRRISDNPRYTNAYNWVNLDLEAGQGSVYLRRWNDRKNEWTPDTDTHDGGKFVLDNLPKKAHEREELADDASTAPLAFSSRSRFERPRKALEGYLNALISNNTDLEPGGIKQTKVHVVLPLDSIYIGLQADRDRPDVDRRVMQEELDEIKKNLAREEDPAVREKQYQIWAHNSRIIQKALEVSGPREELSSIVQRHRQVVILGGPGSGKTTLVRYLTLCLARAVLAEPERLFDPLELVDQKKLWSLPELGPVRLPILLSVSHYAEARQKDRDLGLVDYLPRYFAGLSVPHSEELGKLFQTLLDHGRCMVLLDGLDEIIDPADRRNIAASIGQFASVYRDTGLPDWLSHLLSQTSLRSNEIQWATDTPEDVKADWGKRIQQRQDRQRRELVFRMARDLLNEKRYAHVGNRFVVTSRIAGYHFAGVPGEFEHFTIRRMSLDDIKRFLGKWCPAVERRIAEAPDAAQVEQRARREIDGILKAVETTPGVRRMAETPLLLRILAIIHRNEAHLPQRRVELYETASVTLLRDWHREKGMPKEAEIDDVKATSLLGPLALHIHESSPTGFLSLGETERILGTILARDRGEKDPEHPSLETLETVQDFLKTVREHSGLFVERGEGLFGFMHLTFEEYFTARQLVSSAARAQTQILQRLHQPRWREPILLAVGSLSKQFYDDTQGLLRALLEAKSTHEAVLHRDLLFTAACIGDSVNVAPVLRQEIAHKLLTLYCDRSGSGRFNLLQKQVKDALLTLCNDQGDVAVENALAEILSSSTGDTAFKCALDVVDWLRARTPIVAKTLANHPRLNEVPQAEVLLRAVQTRVTVNDNRAGATPTSWESVKDHAELSGLIGACWHYGQSSFLIPGLQISKEAIESARQEIRVSAVRSALKPSQTVLKIFSDTPKERRNVEFWNSIIRTLNEAAEAAPYSSSIRTAAGELLRAGVDSPGFTGNTSVAARVLQSWSFEKLVAEGKDAPTLSLEQALVQFADVVQQSVAELTGSDYVGPLQSAGHCLLAGATAGDTLAPVFMAHTPLFDSFRSQSDEDNLRLKAEQAQIEIGNALINVLRSPASAQQYQDAASCLVNARLKPLLPPSADVSASKFDLLSREATQIIAADLENDDAARSIMALRTLVLSTGQRHRQISESHRARLLRLLNASNAQSALASEILFAAGMTSELLSWCWSVLRDPDHPLQDTVLKHLNALETARGERDTLRLIDQGLREDLLRPHAIQLMYKIAGQGTDTFIQSLAWLEHPHTTVRHVAAILLTEQEAPGLQRSPRTDLLAVPHSILVSATRPSGIATSETWRNLSQDSRMMRLLGGLWLGGWKDVLAIFWTGQPYGVYRLRKRAGLGPDSSSYHESREIIQSILETDLVGNGLIFLFRRAATRLAELEGPSPDGVPETEHIATVQAELLEQAENLLKQPETPPELAADVIAFLSATENDRSLIALCGVDTDQPLPAWLRKTSADGHSVSELTPGNLALLLADDDFYTRMTAAVLLICRDVPTLLLTTLMDAAKSSDDRVRTKSRAYLMRIGNKLRCDATTSAPEKLIRTLIEADDRDDGVMRQVLFNAVISLNHEHPVLINSWLDSHAENDADERLPLVALSHVSRASDEVLLLLSKVLNDSNARMAVRRVVALGLHDILRVNNDLRKNEIILAGLTTALNDPEDWICDNAAYGMQWIAGPAAWPAAIALQRAVTDKANPKTRYLALISLGRMLYTVRGFRDVDISREALFRWLETQTTEDLRFGGSQTVQTLRALSELTPQDTPDAEAIFAKMAEPEALGLSQPDAARLMESRTWSRILKTAKEEWELRRYWLEKIPFLPAAIAQVEFFLSDSDPTVRRAAAHALACIYHGEDDRPARLRDLLPDDSAVLHAMLDAASDADAWSDESKTATHHPWAVKQIVGWLEARSQDERGRFVDKMMDDLAEHLQMTLDRNKEFSNAYRGWPPRRILMAVLAEVSERLTYRAFINTRELEQVVDLFALAANDQENHDGRRFAIRILGNLQQLTKQVADIFFAACQDVSGVYNETRTAVTKFNVFDAGSLERLTEAIKEPSITVAYHAALLLGELGLSRSEDLGSQGRERVADQLVQLLHAPLSARIVYDFTTSIDGVRVGALYDVIYEALVRVVAGPDAPIQSITEEPPGRENVSTDH